MITLVELESMFAYTSTLYGSYTEEIARLDAIVDKTQDEIDTLFAYRIYFVGIEKDYFGLQSEIARINGITGG